ncbi:MAG: hypothetical protein WAL25_12525 [Acidimicrobiia bacterium]
MFRVMALVAAVLVVSACADSLPPLEGIDLPPASMPHELEPGFWAVSFAHDYEPGSWAEGPHHYTLSLDCDVILDEPLASGQLGFAVRAEAQAFPRVFMRLTGLGSSLVGPTDLLTIETDQPATAVITVLGVAEADAEAASDGCAGQVVIDGNGTETLVGGEPFRP